MEVDVVVVGSGAAGLCAAIVAHDRGLRTLVLEKTEFVGGTTAISGGAVWAPENSLMASVDQTDSPEEVRTYLAATAREFADTPLMRSYLRHVTEMVDYLRFALQDPGGSRPSIETLLHGFLPAPAVFHTHADAIVSLTNNANAERLKLNRATVGKWRTRFVERRIAGLYDDVRSGKPRTIDYERIAQLIKTTLRTEPANGSTHWSVRMVAPASNNSCSASITPSRHTTQTASRSSGPPLQIRSLKNFIHFARVSVGQDPRAFEVSGPPSKILVAVEDQRTQKQVLVSMIVARYGENLGGLRFAVWGLAFKPGTDDMREAHSRVVIDALQTRGAAVQAHDQVAADSARAYMPESDKLVCYPSAMAAIEGWSSSPNGKRSERRISKRLPRRCTIALSMTGPGAGLGLDVSRHRSQRTGRGWIHQDFSVF